MPEDPLGTEYYKLLEVVTKFDERLMTVKSWGATVSVAALVVGFQGVQALPGTPAEKSAAGSFVAACLSGLSFWAIDAAMKRHQMRYYVRMREIEVVRAEDEGDRAEPTRPSAALRSSPQIDWSWSTAADHLGAGGAGARPKPELYRGRTFTRYFWWLYPHVALPHALAVIAGGVAYALWRADRLGLLF